MQINPERISLRDTRQKNSYQTDVVSTTSSHDSASSTTDLVMDDMKPCVTLKQIIYLFLVTSILISAIAVTFFAINNNRSHNGNHIPTSSSDGAVNTNYMNDISNDTTDTMNTIVETSSYSKGWFINEGVCETKNYLKDSLKLQYTANFGGIVMDLKNTYKYEASGVRYDRTRNKFFVVFDSLYGLGSIDPLLQRSYQNTFIPTDDNIVLGESGFEGIAIDPETNDIHVVTEAVEYTVVFETHSSSSSSSDSDDIEAIPLYRALISKINFEGSENNEDGFYYSVSSHCMVGYNFTSSNKGLEGLSLLQNSKTGKKYFLGLCEGNYCMGGDKGKDSGHGRMLVISHENEMKNSGNNISDESQITSDGLGCEHKVEMVVELPKSVYFTDYSAMSFRNIDDSTKYRVIIVSQEDSAAWIGHFDLNTFKFSENGNIYVFPKDVGCIKTLCNVEGIDWIDDNTVVAVSDKTKSKGRQQFECSINDQSIHIFTIPP